MVLDTIDHIMEQQKNERPSQKRLIQDLEESFTEFFQKNIKKIKKTLEKQEELHQEVQIERDVLHGNLQQVQEDLERVEGVNSDLSEKANSLEEQLDETNRTNFQLLQDLGTLHKGQSDALNAEAETTLANIALQKEIERLQEEMKKKDQEYGELEFECDANQEFMGKDICRLQDENNKLQEALNEAIDQNRVLEEENNRVEDEKQSCMQELEARWKADQHKHDWEREEQTKRHKTEMAQLEDENQAALADVEERYQADLVELKRQLTELKAENSAMRVEASVQEDENEQLKIENTRLLQVNTELQDMNVELIGQQPNGELKAQLKFVTKQRDQVLQILAQKKGVPHIESPPNEMFLECQRNGLQDRNDQLTKLNQELQAEIQRLQATKTVPSVELRKSQEAYMVEKQRSATLLVKLSEQKDLMRKVEIEARRKAEREAREKYAYRNLFLENPDLRPPSSPNY